MITKIRRLTGFEMILSIANCLKRWFERTLIDFVLRGRIRFGANLVLAR